MMRERSLPPPPDSGAPREARARSFTQVLGDPTLDPIARRDFLGRMAAAIALAGLGLGACTRAPREEIVPYVKQPRETRPGSPRHYATACVLDGYATGIMVESHVGRPTKVEGNPLHPASLGAAGAFEQASVLSLYDPTRARGVAARGGVASWEDLARALTQGRWAREGGRGLHLLLEPTSSPTLIGAIEALRQRYPRIAVSFHPSAAANAWEGSRIAFGRVLESRFALDRADVIVALDADFLASGAASLRYSRQFAERRAPAAGAERAMNRLYVVEPLVTVTGMNADHRFGVCASEVRAIAAALAVAVKIPELAGTIPPGLPAEAEPHRTWIDAVARDLVAHRGRSVVIAGDAQPPEVHALAHALNAALGNVGSTVTFAPSPIVEAGERSHGLEALSDALAAGEVDTLVVCGGNPVYTSPRGHDLARLFARARQSAYLGLHDDETAAACTFTIARAHPLESWGDARAFDGTVSIVQPLIEPLFDGRTEIELLALFTSGPQPRAYDLVRGRFREVTGTGAVDLERAWRAALRRGIVDGSATSALAAAVSFSGLAAALARATASPAPALAKGEELELVSRLDPHVHDGRFANNAWLLELPSPAEKLTWTNAATISPATARALGIESGAEIELRTRRGAAVKAPACIVTGQADGTVGLSLGWGRTRGAELAQGRGADAFALADDHRRRPVVIAVAETGAKRDLPITQTQRTLEGRDAEVLRHTTFAEYAAGRNGAGTSAHGAGHKRQLSLYDREPGPSPWQWGMAIDLSRCTGCGACVLACQAENNVPTVGPDNVVLNREMHWLRIDSYVVGAPNEPRFAPQPMLCQHCEMAPCEYVCPVNATVHSPDGLNEMIYNRCVGTRFCSNNCPYKVRRFNWFDFHRGETPKQQLVHNPDVTVRERGVMEKCTFCVQRLRQWEIKKQQGRPADPPRTACQQTCPAQAIVFGDVRDPASDVSRLQASDRAFKALDDLGTEPRVRYLARLTNPNPELS